MKAYAKIKDQAPFLSTYEVVATKESTSTTSRSATAKAVQQVPYLGLGGTRGPSIISLRAEAWRKKSTGGYESRPYYCTEITYLSTFNLVGLQKLAQGPC